MSEKPSQDYSSIVAECMAAAAFAVLVGVVFAASPGHYSSFKSLSAVIGDYVLAYDHRR